MRSEGFTPTLSDDTTLLRFSTAGSVDDGKSTLIGRLLFDTRQVMDDQLAHIEEASRRRGWDRTELNLLTDGLRAEREQGITIDVAYRYFSTAKRKFIVADTPGHLQYTRNMVTGASTSDVAVILVDARQGLTEQSRRHAFIAARLGVGQLLFCVNKMDLVGWGKGRFDEVGAQIDSLRGFIGHNETRVIPVSALLGDNVVESSTNMPWYGEGTLLSALEGARGEASLVNDPFRFAVQWVVRPGSDAHHDYRAYAGRVASGTLRPGDEVAIWPEGHRAKVMSIDTLDGPLDVAVAGQSVALRLDRDLDVARAALITRPDEAPRQGRELTATLCWFNATPSRPGSRYLIKHATRTAVARVGELSSRWDMATLTRQGSPASLELNDIGEVRLSTSATLAFDTYAENRTTGSFILIDEATHDTVAGGMILGTTG